MGAAHARNPHCPASAACYSRRVSKGMLMRNFVSLALLALALAGCGRGGGQNQANASGLPTPGARPQTSAPTDQDLRQSYRELSITGCVRAAQANSARGSGAPPGTDFRRYCTCAVDGMMAGLTTQQLMGYRPGAREQRIATQCAQEMGLTTNFGGGGGR
jgi:hypothetical protein